MPVLLGIGLAAAGPAAGIGRLDPASSSGHPVTIAEEARILALEDRRDAGNGRIEAWLGDQRPAMRARAGLALGRIGTRPAVWALMVRLAAEPDPAVRAHLAFALGVAGSSWALKPLIQALTGDPSVMVRGRAAEALGRIGSTGALRALLAALPPAGSEMRPEIAWMVERVIVALLRLGDLRAVPGLLVCSTREGGVGRMAVWALARLKAGAARERFLELSAHPDPWTRKWAARGLGDLRPGQVHQASRRALDAAVLRLAGDPDPGVRVAGLRALAQVPGPSARARLMEAAAGDDDPRLRIEAVTALGSHPGADTLRFLERIGAAPGNTGRAVDRALARLGLPEERLLERRRHHRDGDLLDRLEWVLALGDATGPACRRTLESIARGRGPWLRASDVLSLAALSSLADHRAEGDAALFREFLGARDPLLRATAARALLESEGHAAIDEALAATRAGSGPEEESRLEVARALGRIDHARSRDALRRWLDDESRLVRLAALEQLETGAGTRPAVGSPLLAGEVRRAEAPGSTPGGSSAGSATYREAASWRDRILLARVETSRGSFDIELLPSFAPLTVANFVSLARRGFFDQRVISRVVPDFVVQMGDTRGDLNGSPGYTIRCEPGGLPYIRGTVGMALAGKDTGGCQFFVTHSRQPHLDGIYTVFGEVVAGMDVVDRIERGDRISRITIRDPGGAGAGDR